MHPFKGSNIRVDEADGFPAQSHGDPKAQKHVFPFARLTDVESGFVQSVVYAAKPRTIIPLNHMILNSGTIDEVPQQEGLFFRGPIQTEDNF